MSRAEATLERLARLAGHSIDLRTAGGSGGRGVTVTELGGVLAGTDELGYLLIRYVAVDDKTNTAPLLAAATRKAAEEVAHGGWTVSDEAVERLAWIAIKELAKPTKNLVQHRALELDVNVSTWRQRYAKPYAAIYSALNESLTAAAAIARRRM